MSAATTVPQWQRRYRVPAPIVERTLRRMLAGDLGPSIPSQLLALGWLPRLDEIAAQRRAFLERQILRGSARLRERLPEWTFEDPGGSSALWVDTGLSDASALVAVARRHGVHIASGAITMPGSAADGHLRVCVDRPWPIVEAGIERLAAAWHDLERRPERAAG